MDQEDLFWTTEAMIRVGGGFVSRLGELTRKGDQDNQRKLIKAFPEYWNTYQQIGINKRDQWQAED